MTGWRATLAEALRQVAARLDPNGAPQPLGVQFRYAPWGIELVTTGRQGCPLLYRESDHHLAEYFLTREYEETGKRPTGVWWVDDAVD